MNVELREQWSGMIAVETEKPVDNWKIWHLLLSYAKYIFIPQS